MKRFLVLFLALFLITQMVFATEELKNEVKVYVYNFKEFSYRFTNPFQKADQVIKVTPSVEAEIRDFQEREFTIALTLYDSKGNIVFAKSQEVKRVEEDKYDYAIVKFWLEDKIPFPEKALVEITTEKGSFQKEITLKFARIYGRSTNFDGSPRQDYLIANDNGFENVYAATCDENGYYEMILPQRTYNTIIANNETYGKTTLETWAWNFTASEDTELNFHVASLEVYNLYVWPNNGGARTVFISFRPMSVHRANQIDSNKDGELDAQEIAEAKLSITEEEFKAHPFSGLAPILDENKVKVVLDGEEVKVVSVKPYAEYVYTEEDKNYYQTAYIVQAMRGSNRIPPGRHFIRVEIEDELLYEGEKIIQRGEASYYWLQEGSIHAKPKYRF